jgi:catechol-2,3-dioxygenase
VEAAPLTGLSHIQLHVSDLDASVAWYETALGLVELRRTPGRSVTLHSAGGGFRVVLSPGGPTGDRSDEPRVLNHLAFGVADLHALTGWADHLMAVGIAHDGIKTNFVGQSIDLFDPDGNNIELVSETS